MSLQILRENAYTFGLALEHPVVQRSISGYQLPSTSSTPNLYVFVWDYKVSGLYVQ